MDENNLPNLTPPERDAVPTLRKPTIQAIVPTAAGDRVAEASRAEAAKAHALIELAMILPQLGRGDKTFIKAAARKVYGMEPPKRRKVGGKVAADYTGEKSLSQAASFLGINTTSFRTASAVFYLMEEHGIVTPGKVKGYILKPEYGRTLKPNSEARPMFSCEGARKAFGKIGLL